MRSDVAPPLFLPCFPACFSGRPQGPNGPANFRAIEKRILDSIIGQGRYDCRIRPMGINNT
ncbi:unnamed protein product, partial [Ixodes pacificus]